MICYADASFIASLYLNDRNTSAALDAFRKHAPIFISELTRLEVINAFCLSRFHHGLSEFEAARAVEMFARNCRSGAFRLAGPDAGAWERAVSLATNHTAAVGTRTLDILHVAVALRCETDLFLTFDKRQAVLADRVGLRTDF